MSKDFIDDEIVEETINKNEDILENGVEDVPLINAEQEIKDEFEEKETAEELAPTESPEEVQEEEQEEEWIDLLGSGAIMKKIIIKGEPDMKPQRLEKCIINYSCLLEDETIVESAGNFELNLGESDVIQGLDVSIGLMNLKEKCRLKIEPRLAFGARGLPPKIPGNVPIIYDVELIGILPEDEVDTLTVQERKSIGNKKRERGNWWYTRGENNIAIQCYRRALDYLDEVEGGITGPLTETGSSSGEVSDSDLQSLFEDRMSVCNNMAAAQIKMEMFEAALNSLQIVLRCQPNNVKAHFRQAKVYKGTNDMPMAMKCLQKAKDLAPNDIEIQKEIRAVAKLLDRQKHSERELARRMFNGSKKSLSETCISKKGARKSKVGLWTTLGATVAVGVAGLVAYRFKYA